jgi:hypothetical protein
MSLDPNRLILTGENPFIRLSDADGGAIITNASFWRILISPAGGGHVLYLKSDLIQDRWKVYSDNSETRLSHIKQRTSRDFRSAEPRKLCPVLRYAGRGAVECARLAGCPGPISRRVASIRGRGWAADRISRRETAS